MFQTDCGSLWWFAYGFERGDDCGGLLWMAVVVYCGRGVWRWWGVRMVVVEIVVLVVDAVVDVVAVAVSGCG